MALVNGIIQFVAWYLGIFGLVLFFIKLIKIPVRIIKGIDKKSGL